MVKKEPLVYLFTGEDTPSKDMRIRKLKDYFLSRDSVFFNLDTFYGKDLDLHSLQKSLLCLPVNSKKRMIVIRQAESLKQPLKDFLLQYARNPSEGTILVLDMQRYDLKDDFTKGLLRYASVLRFREEATTDSFVLARCIEQRKAGQALKVLRTLLKNGERPERILGGLRYGLLKSSSGSAQEQKKIKLFLECDLEIKTGRLKSAWALERFIIGLCALAQQVH